jgi:alkanesulfonate monooxygenase SsuD/methylene tetrahydromethanopterin reductase-like flavin-dependent oxidoreductase (luciferase family)
VRFGVSGGPFGDWPRLQDFVAEAEALGADSYWIPDHPTFMPDWAPTLAALAGTTGRIRLGPLVNCVSFRSAPILARQAADVDRLSGGRLVLGLGAGHHEPEFRQMGVPFGSLRDRLNTLGETIDVLPGMWAGPVTFAGASVRLVEMTLREGPIQQPRIPILIGGGGKRVTVPRIAAHADAANFSALPPAGGAMNADDARRTLSLLREHCESLGRPFDSVLATHFTHRFLLGTDAADIERKAARLSAWVRPQFSKTEAVVGTPKDVIPYYRGMVDAGLRYFILRIWEDEIESVRLFAAEVLPALRDYAEPMPKAEETVRC